MIKHTLIKIQGLNLLHKTLTSEGGNALDEDLSTTLF